MPINFRILGGNSSSNSNNNNNNTSRSFMGSNFSSNNNNNNSNSNSNTRSGNSNQSTYPGLRAQRSSTNNNNSNSNSNNNNDVGIGVGSNTSRGLFSSINRSMASYNNSISGSSSSNISGPYVASAPPQPHVVIRGSSVNTSPPPTHAAAGNLRPQSMPSMPSVPPRSSVTSFQSSMASSNRSSASTTFPSSTTPYVDNSTTANSNNDNDNRPGAFSVTRSTEGRSSQVYRVTVPPGVIPGNEFTVHAGNRRVRVRCPLSSRSGHSLQITLPPEPVTSHKHLNAAPLTRACKMNYNNTNTNTNNPAASSDEHDHDDVFMRLDSSVGSGGAVAMTPEVQNVNRAASNSGKTAQTFLVTVPPNIYPGMQFTVNAEGQRFMVTCPPNAGPNTKVRIVPPAEPEPEPMAAPKTQVFEVIVPQGVRPNQPFTLMANGQRVLVTCPPNVYPGQKIRFQLPVNDNSNNSNNNNKMNNIQLSYKDDAGSSGWERIIRMSDMKFQWVRVDGDSDTDNDCDKKKKASTSSSSKCLISDNDNNEDGESMGAKAVEDMEAFDFSKAAYVRKIQYLEGNDARMRTGSVCLVPAQEAVVDSKLVEHSHDVKHKTKQIKTLLQYTDIANVQSKSLEDKMDWFHKSICEELYTPWEQGHVKIVVRRHHLLVDSVDAIMALGRDDMRKRWRIDFAGEPGIEAGGLTREWFQLVTEQIFDPDFGLWLSSSNNQMSMQINAASHISCPDDHLIYFRFLGRVLGRALFDRQLVKGHMVRHLYKHLLGWPVTFDDLEAQDEAYYNALKKFTTMEDLSIMCLDFTVTEETLGVMKDVELVPGGNMKEVNSENLHQYLEANLKYRMLNRCKPQITELMLGFFDIIPEPALTVFDPNELELILCGLPTIDMNDWMDNTKYSGYYESKGRRDDVVKWFWEVVQHDFDQEMKARLLQFVTGTSGVPPRGFAVLQGNDGNIKKFCVHGVSRDQYVYPRAHTCFNRIDLPNYSSKKELREKVGQAVSMTYVGFDIE